jgi:serine/threonine protein kinase
MLNSETPRLTTGGQAARDEVLGRLGAGGMAEVWLLRRRGVGGFEKYFALKRIRTELLDQSHHVAMFLDEARLAAMLHHPGIVQVFDIGEDELGFWYVMEYVRGRSVGQVLRRAKQRGKPMPVECAVYIGQQLARALHYAHHLVTSTGPLGLVHRDVSPGNVLLGFDGGVKLADFGVARASNRLAETVGGEFKGKYVYASPEQVRGERVDSRSDLFSAGLVIHELITGARVFGDDVESPFQVIQAVLHAPIHPPSASQAACPSELDAVVLRAVHRDLERRFATGAELAMALERIAGRMDGRASAEHLTAYLADLYGDEARSPVPANLEPSADPMLPRSVVTGDSLELDLSASVGPRPVSSSRPAASSSRPVAAASSVRAATGTPQWVTDPTALVRTPTGALAASAAGTIAATSPGHRPGDVRSVRRLVEESSGELVEPRTISATSLVNDRRSRNRMVAVAALSFVVAAVALGVTLGRDRGGDGSAPVVTAPAAAVVEVPAPEAPAALPPAPLPAPAGVVVEPTAAPAAARASDAEARPSVDERRTSSSRSERDRSRRRKAKRSSSRDKAASSSSAEPSAKDASDVKDAKDGRDRPRTRDAKPAPGDLLEGIQPWTP